MWNNKSPGVATAWRGPARIAKRVQLCRPRFLEKPVPCVRAERHHTGEAAVLVAKSDRAQQRGKVGAERSHNCPIVVARVERDDQKDGRARQRRGDRLRHGARTGRRSGRDHRIPWDDTLHQRKFGLGTHATNARWRSRARSPRNIGVPVKPASTAPTYPGAGRHGAPARSAAG